MAEKTVNNRDLLQELKKIEDTVNAISEVVDGMTNSIVISLEERLANINQSISQRFEPLAMLRTNTGKLADGQAVLVNSLGTVVDVLSDITTMLAEIKTLVTPVEPPIEPPVGPPVPPVEENGEGDQI